MAATQPVSNLDDSTAPIAVIEPAYKDPSTGALYVHSDLARVQEPWAEEAHIKPVAAAERFGDVESFAAYVERFKAAGGSVLATYNAQGLRAVLDYHGDDGTPSRAQWTATHTFVHSLEWRAWMALANGQPVAQRALVEKLEDLADDVSEPAAADLTNLLRNLRATVNARADAELRPDGTTSVVFAQDKAVKSGSSNVDVSLPSTFQIVIPVLKGHVEANGAPVKYALQVRLRATVDDNAKLAFRLTIPLAERTLEDVVRDRVETARRLLPDVSLLRAAD